MKQFGRIYIVLVLLCTALPLYADPGGCTNSPECPTALLGVVGFVGAGFTYLRERRRRK